MKTLTFVTSLLFLSSFISHSLSRPITQNSTSVASTSAAATAGDIQEDWFHHHHFSAHSPLPSWHKKRWPFVHPPMHHGGFKWDYPHGLPPMMEKPWPHKDWPSADAPMTHGWKRHHHWPIMHSPFPWWPEKDYVVADVAADEIEAAAPPLAA